MNSSSDVCLSHVKKNRSYGKDNSFPEFMVFCSFIEKNKNAKALKLHSVILLFSRLYAIIAFLQRLSVILTVVFDQMHSICTYS